MTGNGMNLYDNYNITSDRNEEVCTNDIFKTKLYAK